jgi:hypothetical protein
MKRHQEVSDAVLTGMRQPRRYQVTTRTMRDSSLSYAICRGTILADLAVRCDAERVGRLIHYDVFNQGGLVSSWISTSPTSPFTNVNTYGA